MGCIGPGPRDTIGDDENDIGFSRLVERSSESSAFGESNLFRFSLRFSDGFWSGSFESAGGRNLVGELVNAS